MTVSEAKETFFTAGDVADGPAGVLDREAGVADAGGQARGVDVVDQQLAVVVQHTHFVRGGERDDALDVTGRRLLDECVDRGFR